MDARDDETGRYAGAQGRVGSRQDLQAQPQQWLSETTIYLSVECSAETLYQTVRSYQTQ